MVNVIPPDHDHDVPVVEPNQHDDAPVVPEPVLEDEDEDPKEDPQEDEDDMEIDIEEDENEPELTYPYEEVDPLNPLPPASESEPDNEIEVENPIEHEDETVPVSVYEVGESSTIAIPREDGDRLLPGFMRRDIDSLFDLGNEVRSSVEQGNAAMEKLVEKLKNVEEKAECKKLNKELEEARGFVFEERPNEAIDVPIEDEKSPLSEIMPPKFAPMTQAAIRRMIKESVDAAIAAERARKANVRNDASGSGPVRAVELRRWFKKTKSVLEISKCAKGKKTEMKKLMTVEFCPIEEIQRMKHELGNLRVKEYDIVSYTQRFNELALMCPRMVDPKRVKEGKKKKWESLQVGNSSGKGNQKDNSLQTLQNNQKQGNALAMVIAPTDGKLPLYERCFTRHVGQCMIKCHKCGKVGHKARYCKEKSVATGANAQPIWTCYDCGEQGHTRNRCPKKVKQEEVGEVHGRAYAIKDAEPKGPNVVTGTFLLNNRYASVLFDLGSDRSFVNTRFSSLLDIKPIKIEDSYEVELADGRVLGTFDIIIGMDWLVKHDVVIVCDKKVVRIPYGNKTLTVEGDKGRSRLKIISCIKAHNNHPNLKKRVDVVVGVGGFPDSGGGGGGFGYTSHGGEVEMTKVVSSVGGDSEGGVGDVRCGGDEVEMVASVWRGRRWCGDGSKGGGVSAEDGG
ncbi:putative reverse transcriptase domain-containing protein [Tanacetum coccineum]